MIWRDQHSFSSILYTGGTRLAFEGKHLTCEATTSVGSLHLGYRTVAEVTEAQRQARTAYEHHDKRGSLVWGNSVLFWRASVLTAAGYRGVEIGDATPDLEADFAQHKLNVQRSLA